LYFYRSRYYDPAIGRFIREDLIGFAGGDTNLYRYVGNGPTNFIDPFGYQCQKQILGINPECKRGDIRVSLSRSRLEEIGRYRGLGGTSYGPLTKSEIGRFNDALGKRFEAVALQSAGIPPYTGNEIPTGTNPSNIVHDGLGDTFGLTLSRPPSITIYPESAFVEVKSSGKGSIGPSSFNYQAEGYLRAAQDSPAGRAGAISFVSFITLKELSIGPKYRNLATARGVEVSQRFVYELCRRPGFLQTGPRTIQNPELYIKKSIYPYSEINYGRPVQF
jgi:hypothetical protein